MARVVVTAEDRALGSLLGLAIGDAMGVSQEQIPRFGGTPDELHKKVLEQRKKRKTFRGVQTKMEGGGPFLPNFKLNPGEYTDDTSMALCLADSIIFSQDLNPADLMERFAKWHDEGYNAARYTKDAATGKIKGIPWGVGSNVSRAIGRFKNDKTNPIAGGKDPQKDAGNGSIMRLCPVAIFWHDNLESAVEKARIQSSVTHNVPEAMDACAYLCQIIVRAINGEDKESILIPHPSVKFTNADILSLGSSDSAWRKKTEDEIRTLPGRALWSLEAAIWVIHNTSNFQEAIITAINLAGDADTIAAIVGQMAGAIYGASAIPSEWLDVLVHKDKIRAKAEYLFKKNSNLDEVTIEPKVVEQKHAHS